MTLRPVSKPMRHHDPDLDDEHTRWVCDVHGVVDDPAAHDACRPKEKKR